MTTFRHASLFNTKLERVLQPQKYRLYALTYAEAPYGWGEENLGATDCSGLLCGPLLFMGFNIRVTADRLFKGLFTDEYHGYDEKNVSAVFFIDSSGVARHCGLLLNEEVVMHASGERGVTFDTLDDLCDEYFDKGMVAYKRNINWAKAYELDGEVYDLDEEMV